MKSPPANPRSFRRHALALIASGAVLGLGATAVLANWTDVERVFDEFGTSTFALEGAARNADGTWEPFANHNPTAGTLEAKLDFGEQATRVHPGMRLRAQYRVRLTADTTEPGEVTIKPKVSGEGAVAPLADFIEIGAIQGSPYSYCSEPDYRPNADFSGLDERPFPLRPGEQREYCFLVKFKETNAQGDPLPQGATTDLNKFSWIITAKSGLKVIGHQAAVLKTDGTWGPYTENDIPNLNYSDARIPVQPGSVIGAKFKVRLTSESNAPGRVQAGIWAGALYPFFEPLVNFMESKVVASTADGACDGSAIDFDAATDVSSRDIAPGDEHFYCSFVRFNGTSGTGELLPTNATVSGDLLPFEIAADPIDPAVHRL